MGNRGVVAIRGDDDNAAERGKGLLQSGEAGAMNAVVVGEQ
jgi:hypothetical protein